MADTDALKKYLDAGMAFTHLTRARAEQVVKDLVAAGELQRSQAKSAIDELLDRSRKNAETLSEQVRKEVDSQLASLGLARKVDVERLEAELAELKGDKGAVAKAGGGKAEGGEAPSKPAPAKKTTKKASGDSAGKADDKAPQDASAGGDAGPSDQSAPAKKAGKSSAPAKPAKRAAATGTSPVSTELPGRKVKDEEGGDAPAPAKKATKAKAKEGGGTSPDNSMPAKKSAKKQG